MPAVAEQETREVARPLKTLERLIKEDIAAGDKAGMDYYRSAGEKLNEARYGHYEKEVERFWRWAEKNFNKSRTTLRTWMASGSHRGAKSLSEVEKKAFGWNRPPVSRREYTREIDDIAARARDEARRLAAEDNLTRMQEREAEGKLGLRLISIGYRVLAKELHPDKGGSKEAMHRLGRVRDRLRSNV